MWISPLCVLHLVTITPTVGVQAPGEAVVQAGAVEAEALPAVVGPRVDREVDRLQPQRTTSHQLSRQRGGA